MYYLLSFTQVSGLILTPLSEAWFCVSFVRLLVHIMQFFHLPLISFCLGPVFS